MQDDLTDITLVELTDETGRVVRFRFIAALEHQETGYVVLADLEPETEGEDELLILRVERDEDGAEHYVVLDDAAEVEAVFEQYVAGTLSDALEGYEDLADEDEPVGGVLH